MYKLNLMFSTVVFVVFLLAYSSCAPKKVQTAESIEMLKRVECQTSPAKSDLSKSESANYKVSFIGTWSKETHPTNFPSGAHFSPINGAIHSSDVTIWKLGGMASAGLEVAVERGLVEDLKKEILALKNKAQYIIGSPIKPSPGETEVSFTATAEKSQLTLVSMFAPSHDWFVGINNLDLVKNSKWIDHKVVELQVYDAGTEDGNSFSLIGLATTPQENISLLKTPASDTNLGNSGSNPGEPFVGRFIICRQ